MAIFNLDNSIYYFVKCLSCFEKEDYDANHNTYYEYLKNMSVTDLNKEYDLLTSFKYHFKYLSNSIISNLYNSIIEFDENHLKEILDKLYKEIEQHLLKILKIINGETKIPLIEGIKYKKLTKDDVFAFATTVIGASIDNDCHSYGIFDDLLNLLHYYSYFIEDLTYSLYKGNFNVKFNNENVDDEIFLIDRYSDINYENKEKQKELFDEDGNIINENVKYELLRGFNSLIDDYNESNVFISQSINELNKNNPNFHFYENECDQETFDFISDDINEILFDN